jgi:hypothetical protein
VLECSANSSCQDVGDVALRTNGACLNGSGQNISNYVKESLFCGDAKLHFLLTVLYNVIPASLSVFLEWFCLRITVCDYSLITSLCLRYFHDTNSYNMKLHTIRFH